MDPWRWRASPCRRRSSRGRGRCAAPLRHMRKRSRAAGFKSRGSKEIVIDEFIGQSIPLIFFYIILFEALSSTQFFFIIMLVSFIGFRFFDILKPFPINYIDKNIKNGLGVVLDDIIAGIYTAVVLYIFIIIYGNF